MKGIAIAVTRRTKDDNGEWDGWETELKGYGVADRWGNTVDEDVNPIRHRLKLKALYSARHWSLMKTRNTLLVGIPKLKISYLKENGNYRTALWKNKRISSTF
ncbi:hypothetical protein M422DRAFT_36150 [Sphaerobolus stellatus SS14]|uniref:Uncharacterized protein n=1 Tax=Sphaerobolus stellatus (strain SS14) TaxID=990650 RepID=A0A0C9TNU5_SPHS4|nr:hypothetical protein M422DRAFT_36150 [Sphaerobolus stellatus SS14]